MVAIAIALTIAPLNMALAQDESQQSDALTMEQIKKKHCAEAITAAFEALGSKKKASYHPKKDALVVDDKGDLAVYTQEGKKIVKPDQYRCEDTDPVKKMDDGLAEAIQDLKDKFEDKIKDPSVHVGNLGSGIDAAQLAEKCRGIAKAQAAISSLNGFIAQAVRTPRNRTVATQGGSGGGTPANSVD